MIKKKDYIWYVGIVILTLVSRIPLLEKFQSHWDGPDYSIAVVRYSLEQYTPSPPGYPLYIALGKFFYVFTHDPHLGILSVSVLASVLGAVIFFMVGTKMYNRYVGLTATSIFLTGSTFYYFSLTPYAYGLLPGMTTALAYITYRITVLKKNEGWLLGLVFALCFGIRPQEVIQIGSLFLLGFYFLSMKEKLKALLLCISITLLWFIPLIASIGGISKYLAFSKSFASGAFPQIPLIQHGELMLKGFLLSFGLATAFLLYYLLLFYKEKKHITKYITIILFYACWIVPGFIFNLCIRTEHAGYQMSYLSAFVILVSLAIYTVTKHNQKLFISVLLIISTFNLFWFFYNRDPQYVKPYRPTSFHYSDIRKNDLKVGSKVNYILSHFDPDTTMVITQEVLWNPYRYYLKNYALTELSGLDILTPSFVHIRRDTKNWNVTTYLDKHMIVKIPSPITTVVFPDDDTGTWIENAPYTTVHLPGNSTITSMSVTPGEKISYSYHKLRLIK